MHRDNINLLKAGLRHLHFEQLSKETIETMIAFLDELSMWNRRMNLVRGKERDLVVKHLLDSVAPLSPGVIPELEDARRTEKPSAAELRDADPPLSKAPLAKAPDDAPTSTHPKRVLDAGSGAGFPGIPVALVRPEWSVVLADRSEKKSAYLRSTTLTLGIRNIEVRQIDLEKPGREERGRDDSRDDRVRSGTERDEPGRSGTDPDEPEHSGTERVDTGDDRSGGYDIILCRAFAPFTEAVRVLSPFLGRKGVIAFYAGRRSEIEPHVSDAKVYPIDVPYLEGERNLVIIPSGNTSR